MPYQVGHDILQKEYARSIVGHDILQKEYARSMVGHGILQKEHARSMVGHDKSTIYQHFHRKRRYKRLLSFYLWRCKTKEVKNDV